MIPANEITYTATAGSSGPGGQNINRRATKVLACWNFNTSAAVTDDTRERLRERLANRLDREGRLCIVASTRRSQLRNRQLAAARLEELVQEALQVPAERLATTVPAYAVQQRLGDKQARSRRKRERRAVEE